MTPAANARPGARLAAATVVAIAIPVVAVPVAAAIRPGVAVAPGPILPLPLRVQSLIFEIALARMLFAPIFAVRAFLAAVPAMIIAVSRVINPDARRAAANGYGGDEARSQN